MAEIRFSSKAHRDFFVEMMGKCRKNDTYHRAFFYVMGIASETRANINRMFDFKNDWIIPEGMHGGWQTSGTVRRAMNLRLMTCFAVSSPLILWRASKSDTPNTAGIFLHQKISLIMRGNQKRRYFMKQKLLLCGAAAFAVLFLFSAIMLQRQFSDQKQSAEAFDHIADMVVDETEPDAAEQPEEPGETVAPPALTAYEKYAAVYEQNPDFVGWISIDGTNINYPVMQTPGNPDFYLKHAFDKSYSDYGVPYVQENCDLEQSDNVVIYGHHMKNGSMFSDLCKYESEDFYQAHKNVHFDTLADFGEYEIVAAFKTVAYSQEGFKYYHFVNAEDEAAFDEFIAECKSLALYDTGVSAEYGDKLITLSTCEYSRTNGRMVIVAKLVVPSAEEVDADAGH